MLLAILFLFCGSGGKSVALMLALGVFFDESILVNVTAAGIDVSINILQVPLRDLKALQQLLVGLRVRVEGATARCTVSIGMLLI